MSKSTKVGVILKQAMALKDRKLARSIRMSALRSIIKTADELGILQTYQGTPGEFKTREHHIMERGGDKPERDLYGVGVKDHQDSDLSTNHFNRSLSTRYSPDRVGVQARRIADGVYQDPITNKVYDWNEGFKTEDGSIFNGTDISLQTDVISRS